MTYTTVIIGDFNASGGGSFEVIMQKLPPGGTLSGGGGGWNVPGVDLGDDSTLRAIYTQIGKHSNWSDEEKEGLRMLINAYVTVADHSAVQSYVGRWEAKLDALGVPVAALRAANSTAATLGA